MWTLGVDPGRAGAASALAPDLAAEVLWSWRTSENGILVRIAQVVEDGVSVRSARVPSPHGLGLLLLSGIRSVSGQDGYRVVTEAVHVGPNPRTAVRSAYWLGQVLGPLAHEAGEPAQVQPSEWRKAIGVDTRLKDKALKADAVRVVGATVRGMNELVTALGRRSAMAHDFESGGVAWAGAGSRT